MSTVAASFNTIVRQMTEMSHWPNCLSKKLTEMSKRKNSYRVVHKLFYKKM